MPKSMQLLGEGGEEFSRPVISVSEEPAAALHPDVAKSTKPVDFESPLASPALASTPLDVGMRAIDLTGPLPPLPAQSLHPPPLRRLGSALLEDRRVAREHILKASPVLHFTDSWWQTLLSASEYVPPRIYYFVVGASVFTTWLAMRHPVLTTGDNTVHRTQIGFISLLIVFRTSQAYARWWEGRTLWGGIVNSTRNIASNAAAFMVDELHYTRVIIYTIAFAYATKQQLRGRKFEKAEMAGLFSDEETDLMNQVEHIPMLMIDEIRRTIKTELIITKQTPGGLPSKSLDLVMAKDIKALVDQMGGAERIAKTPMPFGYLAQLRIFILLWLVTWPCALVKNYEWASIAMVAFVAFIILKIEEMAVQIEHPFGMGTNDLPIDTICVTIERNLLEILRRAEYLRRLAQAESNSAAADTSIVRLVPPRQEKKLPSTPAEDSVGGSSMHGITLNRIRSRTRTALYTINNKSMETLTMLRPATFGGQTNAQGRSSDNKSGTTLTSLTTLSNKSMDSLPIISPTEMPRAATFGGHTRRMKRNSQ
mmetsp:Transcript_8380/g.21433  ORF Transcript_8380/g.21433 Transcript_8380/m.21433 type:complete len:538 (-) Transcript_8380:137-1750(-)